MVRCAYVNEQSTIDEMTKLAQTQIVDSLKSRPRFRIDLDIDAPKVSLPTEFAPDGVLRTQCLLYLGHLTFRTDLVSGRGEWS